MEVKSANPKLEVPVSCDAWISRKKKILSANVYTDFDGVSGHSASTLYVKVV